MTQATKAFRAELYEDGAETVIREWPGLKLALNAIGEHGLRIGGRGSLSFERNEDGNPVRWFANGQLVATIDLAATVEGERS